MYIDPFDNLASTFPICASLELKFFLIDEIINTHPIKAFRTHTIPLHGSLLANQCWNCVDVRLESKKFGEASQGFYRIVFDAHG